LTSQNVDALARCVEKDYFETHLIEWIACAACESVYHHGT
jgi:hypothetical protein